MGDERKPFHESVVDAINRADAAQLSFLGDLIKGTKIPKNHDEIVAAWEKRIQEVGIIKGLSVYRYCVAGVKASLFEQKAEAEEKAKEPSKAEISEHRCFTDEDIEDLKKRLDASAGREWSDIEKFADYIRGMWRRAGICPDCRKRLLAFD